MKKWIVAFPLIAFFLLQRKANAASTPKKINAFFTNPVEPLVVRNDTEGDGYFGASRKGRAHNGIDFLVKKGQAVVSPCDGVYLRVAFPYGDDKRFSGCALQSDTGELIKIFYVQPILKANTKVRAGDIIAYAQDISTKYSPKMLPHIHLEIWKNGKITDPKNYFD